jgi:hypothetical protein
MQTSTFISNIKTNIITLFDENHLTFPPKIEEEVNDYLKQSEERLQKWQTLYKEGLLTLDETEWLVISQRELITLHMLKSFGVNQATINALQNSILKIILKTIIINT